MSRVFNFSAGPANLPEVVLQQIREELLDWSGQGMSVMEASHRSKAFLAVAEQAEADLRALLDIGADYRVLFLQGGATLQFAGIPMNLTAADDTVDYVLTGSWSKKAAKEAARYANVNIAADSAAESYSAVPEFDTWNLSADAAYVHVCINETIGGVEFPAVPTVNAPLVADMSSTLLSRPIPVDRFGIIYAGAQKNIGPAGLTIVIVHQDLIGKARPGTPTVMDFKAMADADSMLNTPPTFAWYTAGLVFAWLRGQGGLAAVGKINEGKAQALYTAIDGSDFYSNPVKVEHRSWMNVPFVLANPELDGEFLQQAAEAGLTNLKGHRSVGGMRASIYNAMPREGVDQLIQFMAAFEASRG